MDINSLFKMLSWNSSEAEQRKGIEEAKRVRYLSVFMQPIEDKSIWENCAKVIADKNDEELEIYLEELFYWISDPNWPGAFIILERLKKMQAEIIYNTYLTTVKRAITNKDENWLFYLEEILDNKKLRRMVDENTIKILEKNKLNMLRTENP